MTDAGKYITIVGVVIVVIGLIVWGLGKAGFRGLPGDIAYEGERVKFYFPIVTCIVVSVILTGLAWLVAWIMKAK